MPRENSFSDSDGRSLTPDLEEEFELASPVTASPTQNPPPALPPIQTDVSGVNEAHSGRRARPSLSTKSPASRRMRSPGRGPLTTTSEYPPQRPPLLTPRDRFRASVRKVMAMHRTSSMMSRNRIGAEPGVDPRRQSAFLTYGHIKQKCLIEVVDYSAVRSSFGRMTNKEFISFLADDGACAKEPWVKVRWINVGGISWDVISALALRYDVHPLALEDVLHARKNGRSKADYYSKHLFIRILAHCLGTGDALAGSPDNSVTQLPRSASPTPLSDDEDEDDSDSWEQKGKDDEEKTVYGTTTTARSATVRNGTLRNAVKRRLGSVRRETNVETPLPQYAQFPQFGDKNVERKRKDLQNIKLIRELKRGDRVNVKIMPMYIFLFRDGTVITIHEDNALSLTAPITERLRQRDTGLRATADASLLVQSLLDLVVDSALEVIEDYQHKILKLEQAVLIKPSMKHVRRLHILQGDLILHKRTLEPIKTLVYGLRRYDVDRVAALEQTIDPTAKIQGYMSHKSKIYLADVHDHMEYILSSLDMFAGISDNLINYTFNMTSYEMNEVMRRLTLATIIFLPLTLLTGYFGMNFDFMWTIKHGHTDLVFWAIALPVMGIVVPLFLWSDLERIFHYMQKRWLVKGLKKVRG
ncbi:hypothetical protein BDY19DRAFT_915920 [Irpex rosettiformis]|uniref:Uncharacterized protein n=1 Tax=Irpex rosettiformis TaxID=378272 RepID=A0ACB8UKU4_9APHY|nr:hypothetical protein BDY19DRAFT_915920 [Irpex rosettiformis]